ncbi:MAG: T9SS type A sorting domain-containing protein [Saprospiraceae bacterium]|nr:T9SS type A sorting domain-containing protein [Saprospiraceae bacterium]
MRIQSFNTAFQISIFFLFLRISCPLFASSNIVLADILDKNGRITNPQQLSGAVDFSGYIPVIDECQGLVMVPPPLAAGWNAIGSGLNNDVIAMAVSGNDIYVGGLFTDAGGVASADYIARWDGASWNAVGNGFNGFVNAITFSGSDMYVGGRFTDAGGNANADRIVRLNGGVWEALGGGLPDVVRAIVVDGSNVYVGGDFVDAAGIAAADYVARWNGTSWNAMGSGLNSVVYALALSGSQVYVGGLFTNAGGTTGANCIARWTGSSWQALGSGLNNLVISIAISGSEIYAGGWFTDAGGLAAADYIARWNGSSWSAVGTTLNNQVYSIALAGNYVYAGGKFTNAGGNANADFISYYNGSSWQSLGTGVNDYVYGIQISNDDVYVGGQFLSAGGVSGTVSIARWEDAVLPVELLTFRAHAEEKQVLLDWRTASETDNLGWDIERSADGRQWQSIGFRAGKGTTSVAQAYTFTDEQPSPGQNYYRLRQSDHNGQYEYSPVVQVMMPASEEQTGAFFPNPAHPGLVSLQYDAEKEGDLHVSVFDAHGRLMIHQNQSVAAARNLLQFDFSPLSPGTYAVLLDNGISQVTRTLTIQ